MKNNSTLNIFLISYSIAVAIYTCFVFVNDGFNILNTFYNNVVALKWAGQFNLDFSGYLILAALWIAWRSKFTISSLLLSGLSMCMGILFFSPYILFLLTKEKGNLIRVLVGSRQ